MSKLTNEVDLPGSFPLCVQALALPKATSHSCLSWDVDALRYKCCSPGMTRSSLVLSIGLT